MLNAHSRLGVAQIIFYTLPVVATLYLCLHHRRPRQPWLLLFFFSLMRIAGGVVSILMTTDDGSGTPQPALVATTIVLLSVGVVPLTASTLGMLRLIFATDFPVTECQPSSSSNRNLHTCLKCSRLFFFAGITLLVTGGALLAHYNVPDLVAAGDKLIKAGYVVVALALGVFGLFQAWFWWMARNGKVSGRSISILQATTIATPFLVVRMVYAFLFVFHPTDARWDSVGGPVAVFVAMALAMEYVVVATYVFVGLRIPRVRPAQDGRNLVGGVVDRKQAAGKGNGKEETIEEGSEEC